MKKATLTKQGKYWKLNSPDFKFPMSIPGGFNFPEELNGKEVEYDNSGGPVKLIRFEGKDYTKQQAAPRAASNQRGEGDRNYGSRPQYGRDSYRDRGGHQAPRNPARAPYNFVPLNDTIVAGNSSGDHSVFEGHSGYIDLTIKAKTDLFIRGRLQNFFSINGNMAIPGSSLRGLTRSLLEIVSYGKMEFVDKDRRLFFRNIGDNYYKDEFLNTEKRGGTVYVQQKSRAGWLTKNGNRFFLQEAPSFYKVNRNQLRRMGLDRNNTLYDHQDIWFDPNRVQPNYTKNLRNTTLELAYNIAHDVSTHPRNNWTKGKLLITGLFGSRKHFQWIIPDSDPSTPLVEVTDIMRDYAMDESREEGADLLRALQRADNGPIPCFFVLDQDSGNPMAIGHTGIFRLPYKHKVGNAVKQETATAEDFAKSIFGFADVSNSDSKTTAGKVFFEDAVASEIAGTEFAALKILSSPKPTSFQLYLEQTPNDHNYKIPENNLHHWGTTGHRIRGNKTYWHNPGNWRHPEVVATAANQAELIQRALVEKVEQFTVAEVLKEGSVFNGRVRFENLTDEELGALLLALDLPEGCCHKIGMGKPLGLGSIRIDTHLTLIDRDKRYRALFTENGNWEAGATNEESRFFHDAFANYMGTKSNQRQITHAKAYWEMDERMQELRCLLTFNHGLARHIWEDRIRYMEIEHQNNGRRENEYKERPVLPKPSQVISEDTYYYLGNFNSPLRFQAARLAKFKILGQAFRIFCMFGQIPHMEKMRKAIFSLA